MMRFGSCSPSRYRRVGVLALALLLLVGCDDADDATTTNGNTTTSDRSSELRAARGGDAAVTDAAGAPGEVALTIELSAGGDRAEVTGLGKCTHTKDASIYDVPAAMWQIQDSDAGKIRHASLTVWRPKAGDGPDQFSLGIGTASAQHRISTVKGGQLVGTGTVTIHPAGQGAHFEVVGTDADGGSVRATFQCARFTEPRVEGG